MRTVKSVSLSSVKTSAWRIRDKQVELNHMTSRNTKVRMAKEKLPVTMVSRKRTAEMAKKTTLRESRTLRMTAITSMPLELKIIPTRRTHMVQREGVLDSPLRTISPRPKDSKSGIKRKD